MNIDNFSPALLLGYLVALLINVNQYLIVILGALPGVPVINIKC
jgi:hypothetical protein